MASRAPVKVISDIEPPLINSIALHLVCVFSVAQLCLTLCDTMGCSPPGSSAHWIFQTRILESVVISSFRGSSLLRDQTRVSCVSYIGRQILLPLSHLGSPCIFHVINSDACLYLVFTLYSGSPSSPMVCTVYKFY